MRMLIFFVLGCLLFFVGWRFVKDFSKVGVKPSAVAAVYNPPSLTSSVSVATTARAVKSEDSEKNIFCELFLVVLAKPYKHVVTNYDFYREGEYCKRGKVIEIRDRMIFVRGFDQRPIIILQDVRKK